MNMKANVNFESSDARPDQLSAWLKEARPAAEPLPPRFASGVWRRIETAEASAPGMASWMTSWLQAVLRPGRIAGALAALMIVGAMLGSVHTRSTAREAARERYLAVVAPNPIR